MASRVHTTPLNQIPANAEELERCLADPEWRIFSGCLYKIMIKGDGEEDAYAQFARRATFSQVTIYTALASAAAGAALAWYFQAARLGAELADERLQTSQYREQIADERMAAGRRVLAVERTVNDKYQGALNDAIQKQAGLQAAADRARRERDGLRKQLSDAEQRLAEASPAALIEYARALGKVFGQCSQRYTELAIRADGHAADAATCRAAWPVIPQTKENPQ